MIWEGSSRFPSPGQQRAGSCTAGVIRILFTSLYNIFNSRPAASGLFCFRVMQARSSGCSPVRVVPGACMMIMKIFLLTLLHCTLSISQTETKIPFHHEFPGFINSGSFKKVHQRQKIDQIRTTAVQTLNSYSQFTTISHVLSPIAFGGDPSGKNDSTIAIKKTISAMLELSDYKDLQGRIDLGGAVLDFGGGIYLIYQKASRFLLVILILSSSEVHYWRTQHFLLHEIRTCFRLETNLAARQVEVETIRTVTLTFLSRK